MHVIRVGCCLYLYENQPPPHLWVVLCDPIPPRDEVLLVMLTTARAYTDNTVILTVGDHPFIERDTAVNYSTASYRPVRSLIFAMIQERCRLHTSMDGRVLRRIQEGVLASPRTINAVRARFVLPAG